MTTTGSRVSKLQSLHDAIAAHVRPGMHINFASTPSRSNAAVLALSKQFRGRDPRFVISATGFHSLAHMLPILGLGRKYIACFMGDNYPVPRPNVLYQNLLAQGADIELWSLWSYVTALRAGAMGQQHALTSSLCGTTMGHDLAARGMFRELPPTSPQSTAEPRTSGLVTAMRADVTFVHGLIGDEDGNVVFSPPHSEGFWGAIGAKVGVIATVERIVDRKTCHRFSDAMKIPPHRVLAVCEAPFGAHPQPLYAAARFRHTGYIDDFAHYEKWRLLASSPTDFQLFEEQVLDSADIAQSYRDWVGPHRLQALADAAKDIQQEIDHRRGSTESGSKIPVSTEAYSSSKWRVSARPGASLIATPRADHSDPPQSNRTMRDDASGPPPPLGPTASMVSSRPDAPARANEILLVLAARAIVARVRARKYPVILAGIGHAFLAARMAKLWLEEVGIDVKVMVETGLFDLECGPQADEFLLSYRNTALARRHSGVEDILGTLTCGADNGCLGVIGAAQIDHHGNLNSTRVENKMLVGSGGANDIATSAAEVVVLTRCTKGRLVKAVDFVTSPGHAVRTVATDLCTFSRRSEGGDWIIDHIYAAHGGRPPSFALDVIKNSCDWTAAESPDPEYAPLISTAEMATVHSLDPQGIHWRRHS
ncbi:MAG: hypothetical protein NVSMB1_12170 [Polyangiales bacterium]